MVPFNPLASNTATQKETNIESSPANATLGQNDLGRPSSTVAEPLAQEIQVVSDRRPEISTRKLVVLINIVAGTLKFHINKIAHLTSLKNVSGSQIFLTRVGPLEYFVGRDEKGVLRGGSPPWSYLNNVISHEPTADRKYKSLLAALAALPANVDFDFKTSPDLADAGIVRRAFTEAGFENVPRKTFLFEGDASLEDQIGRMKPQMRTQVKSARRALEIVEDMNADAFFHAYRGNLIAANKPSFFYLNIDNALFRDASTLEDPLVKVIAVRRKTCGDGNGKIPIDAAIALSLHKDGYCKMMRITYRRNTQSNPEHVPHAHAIKMLIVEAMNRATRLGMKLDTDGTTEGSPNFYSRFGEGIFKEAVQDRFLRHTLYSVARKFI